MEQERFYEKKTFTLEYLFCLKIHHIYSLIKERSAIDQHAQLFSIIRGKTNNPRCTIIQLK